MGYFNLICLFKGNEIWQLKLQAMSLSRMINAFEKEGWDDIDLWGEITDEDLKKMGARSGDVARWNLHFSPQPQQNLHSSSSAQLQQDEDRQLYSVDSFRDGSRKNSFAINEENNILHNEFQIHHPEHSGIEMAIPQKIITSPPPPPLNIKKRNDLVNVS